MRTFTKEYKVYKYEELNNSAKENVKEKMIEVFHSSDIFTEDCKQDLENLFGNSADLEVQYSLGYCQGDGFNIYGSISAEDILNCLENNNGGEQLEEFKNVLTEKERRTILKYAEYCGDIYLVNNARYTYSMADYIDLESWIDDLKYDYNFKNINIKVIDKFEKMVRSIFGNLNYFYEKLGYEFFYEMNEEEVIELCDINEYEFYEDGTLF